MGIYGIGGSQPTSYTPASQSAKNSAKKTDTKNAKAEDLGVVYEASQSTEGKDTNKIKDYSNVVKQLKSAQEQRTAQLQQMVDTLLNKQGKKYNSLSEMFEDVKNGTIEVDPEEVAKAQEEISEDGYWGVNKTSDRLVEMAIALSGDDPSKADTLISAVKKGFEQATKSWGGELPDICQKTIDATTKKLEDWRDGIKTEA